MTGRRQSLVAKRRMSLRRGSANTSAQLSSTEVPWDILDRLFLPIVWCHAAAIIVSSVLNSLYISQVSCIALFLWFFLVTVGSVLFYHFLKVSAQGKSVLITGCDSPLAWFLALKLDELGFTVFAAFKDLNGNDDASLLQDESSARMKLLQLDVTSEIQMLEASLFVAENLPEGATGLWALIHCDIWCALGELEWLPFSVMRKTIDINVLGSARLTQIMMPLIRRAGGRIIFLSSALAKLPSPVRGMQCAAQAAVEGLAICLRQEVRSRRVNVSIVAAGEFTVGTAWLSEAGMLEQAKKMWEQMSDEQKHTYGEDYFETAVRSMEKYTKSSVDMGPAVRCLIDSTIRTFPLARYTPVTTLEKIQTLVAEYLPTPVYETIYRN